jgi:cohesin loading factor subunit SCC2
VIKILKDICMECPEFPKIPEICVKMIRRVNDEEGNLLIRVHFIVIRL